MKLNDQIVEKWAQDICDRFAGWREAARALSAKTEDHQSALLKPEPLEKDQLSPDQSHEVP